MTRPSIVRATTLLALAALGATTAIAQRPPITGTVPPPSPAVVPPAVARPDLPPAPIGGLRTTPLSSAGMRGSVIAPPRRSARTLPAGAWVPYYVADAPWPRAGIVVSDDAAPATVARPRFLPTYEKPQWVRDTTAPRSDLWRDLLVRDVVCDLNGTCLPRTQRVRARWIARCDCYAFADGLGRVWWVENRR